MKVTAFAIAAIGASGVDACPTNTWCIKGSDLDTDAKDLRFDCPIAGSDAVHIVPKIETKKISADIGHPASMTAAADISQYSFTMEIPFSVTLEADMQAGGTLHIVGDDDGDYKKSILLLDYTLPDPPISFTVAVGINSKLAIEATAKGKYELEYEGKIRLSSDGALTCNGEGESGDGFACVTGRHHLKKPSSSVYVALDGHFGLTVQASFDDLASAYAEVMVTATRDDKDMWQTWLEARAKVGVYAGLKSAEKSIQQQLDFIASTAEKITRSLTWWSEYDFSMCPASGTLTDYLMTKVDKAVTAVEASLPHLTVKKKLYDDEIGDKVSLFGIINSVNINAAQSGTSSPSVMEPCTHPNGGHGWKCEDVVTPARWGRTHGEHRHDVDARTPNLCLHYSGTANTCSHARNDLLGGHQDKYIQGGADNCVCTVDSWSFPSVQRVHRQLATTSVPFSTRSIGVVDSNLWIQWPSSPPTTTYHTNADDFDGAYYKGTGFMDFLFGPRWSLKETSTGTLTAGALDSAGERTAVAGRYGGMLLQPPSGVHMAAAELKVHRFTNGDVKALEMPWGDIYTKVQCFDAATTVLTRASADGSTATKRVDALKVGDSVLVATRDGTTVWDTIALDSSHGASTAAYVRIDTADGHALHITPSHYLHALRPAAASDAGCCSGSSLVLAGDVLIGDTVWTAGDAGTAPTPTLVTNVTRNVVRDGAYNFVLQQDGDEHFRSIVASGVVASSFTSDWRLIDTFGFDMADRMLAPVRSLAASGVVISDAAINGVAVGRDDFYQSPVMRLVYGLESIVADCVDAHMLTCTEAEMNARVEDVLLKVQATMSMELSNVLDELVGQLVASHKTLLSTLLPSATRRALSMVGGGKEALPKLISGEVMHLAEELCLSDSRCSDDMPPREQRTKSGTERTESEQLVIVVLAVAVSVLVVLVAVLTAISLYLCRRVYKLAKPTAALAKPTADLAKPTADLAMATVELAEPVGEAV